MILIRRIPHRARTVLVAAVVLLLACSAHHSYTASASVGPTLTPDASVSTEGRVAALVTCETKFGETGTGTVDAAAAPLAETAPGPTIALTFDDGPWPGQTDAILGILRDHEVPATFFMLGCQVERYPELAQLVVLCGMPVGNHSYSHRRLDVAPPEVTEWELSWTTFRIESTTGVRPVWVRPPGGNFGPQVYSAIEHVGGRPALWTVDPQDWRGDATPEEIAWNVISTARPGGVILLHDGGGDQSKTIAALPAIIDGLRAQGYRFVTLDELAEVRGSW